MINNCRVGCYITIPSEIVAEIICNMPYDFIVVDLEHSVVSIEDAQNIIRIAQLYNKKSLVRVSSNNTVEIKKVLDAGADGIIVPMINTVEEAKQAIKNKADYLAFGAFYASKTKKTKYKANLNVLHSIKKITKTPIVAIGGIGLKNYKKLLLNKANFLAISSYIWNNKKFKPIEAIDKIK